MRAPRWPALLAVTFISTVTCHAQPVVRLLYPVEHPQRGLIAYGDVSLTVDAIDVVFGIERVDFYIDGRRVFSDTAYPYSYLWPTADIRRGLYQVKAVARNGRGDATTIEAGVEVVPSPRKRRDGGTAVDDGLLPPINPILRVNMRDPSVLRGADGVYYLVGTTGHDARDMNGGVELWKSADLAEWEYVGLIWSFERDGTWERAWGMLDARPFRAAWSPRLAFVRDNYHLVFSVPGRGAGVYVSTTGKPEGPYRAVRDQPIVTRTDASLFEDRDGTLYMLYDGCRIVTLDAEYRNAGESRWLGATGRAPRLFERDGRYYLTVTRDDEAGRSTSYVGIGDAPTGPFADWHAAVPCGGHGMFFADADGGWWSTFFGDDRAAPWVEWPALLRVDFDERGHVTLPVPPIAQAAADCCEP